jgi:hypothetical protein
MFSGIGSKVSKSRFAEGLKARGEYLEGLQFGLADGWVRWHFSIGLRMNPKRKLLTRVVLAIWLTCMVFRWSGLANGIGRWFCDAIEWVCFSIFVVFCLEKASEEKD